MSPGGADGWHRFVSTLGRTGERATCRLQLTRSDGTFDAMLSCELRGRGTPGAQIRVVLTDVSESAGLERALREAQERLSLVIESSGDGYTDLDLPSGRLTYSARFASMLGYDLDELAPDVPTFRRLVHPEDVQRASDGARPHLRGETEQFDCQVRLRHKTGRWLWIDIRAKVVKRDPGGAPLRFVGTYTDITDRRRAEDALHTALGELNRHLTNTPLALIEWDADYRVTRFGARATEIFGWSSAEVVGKRIDEVPWVPEEDWPIVRAVMNGMDSGAHVTNVSRNRNRRKDGAIINCEWYNSSLHTPDGKLASVFSLVQEVTAMVKAEDALKASEARFRLLASAAAVGIFQTGAQGQILFVNPAYLVMTGLSGTEAYGPGGRLAIHPDDRERVVSDWQASVSAGAIFTSEYRHKLPDGTVNWVRLVGTPLRDAAGSIEGYVGVMAGKPGIARIDVIDRGKGIEPSSLDRIFEPFFTTCRGLSTARTGVSTHLAPKGAGPPAILGA